MMSLWRKQQQQQQQLLLLSLGLFVGVLVCLATHTYGGMFMLHVIFKVCVCCQGGGKRWLCLYSHQFFRTPCLAATEVKYSNDFSSSSLAAYTITNVINYNGGAGAWSVNSGQLLQTATTRRNYALTNSRGTYLTLDAGAAWDQYSFEADIFSNGSP